MDLEMKILYVIREPFGLAGTNASYMFPSLVAQKHDVLVLAPHREGLDQNIVFSNDNISIRYLYEERRRKVAEACLHIEEFKPDVVHIIHYHEALLLPYYGRRMLDHQPKWVCDIRSPLLAPKDKGVRWRRARRRALLLQGYLDCVLTHARPSVKTIFPLCLKRVHTVPPGVDLSAFPAVTPRAAIPARKFLFVGSITPPRQMEFLASAFMALKKASGAPITLDLFGGGGALEDLKQHAQRIGAGDTIRIHGTIAQKQLFQDMHSYDAGISYVPVELYNDAPPLKTMEYAAAGLPILASNTRANRKFQKEGFEMSLFDNTEDDFCRAALPLIKTGLPQSTLENNLAVAQKCDWGAIVENDLLPIYKRLTR